MSSMSRDPVMLELFRAELDEHLPVLSEGLLALEKGRAARNDIESMMRAAHSIKGAARVMGFEPVVGVAHALEDCFTAAKTAKITLTPDSVDVLLAGVDCIQRICSANSADAPAETELTDLLARIAEVGKGSSAPPVVAVTALPFSPPASPEPVQCTAEALLLPADLGSAHAEMLRQQILERLGPSESTKGAPAPSLRLDFSQVERLGAASLAVLLALDPKRSVTPIGNSITTSGVGPGVRALFRVTGLDGVLPVVQ